MKTWNNGASGKEVKKIIDDNFAELDSRTQTSTLHSYTKIFTISDWLNDIISIPYSEHNIKSPNVSGLYIYTSGNYEVVFGGYVIKNNTVELQSDIPYVGKVVIV